MNVFRELGKERIEFVQSIKSQEDWKNWKDPKNEFAFEWGPCWNNTVEYKVSDFEAELGFFIDILGCDCNSLSADYAMFMGPEKEFFLSIRKVKEGEPVTPPDAIKIEFMIKDMARTTEKLKSRGIEFSLEPQREGAGSSMLKASFKTPHGIQIGLWSIAPEKIDKDES